MTQTNLGAIQGAREVTRNDLNRGLASLASNQASLERLLSAVRYDAANDAAAEVLQVAIEANKRKCARLERRLAALAVYESTPSGGACTTP